MDDNGMTLAVGGTALGALCALAGQWIRARFSRARVEPQPLEVAAAPRHVTCEECERRHAEVEKRLAAGDREFRALRDEVAGLRHDVQDGLRRVGDRVAPVAEACAANSQAVRILLEERNRK